MTTEDKAHYEKLSEELRTMARRLAEIVGAEGSKRSFDPAVEEILDEVVGLRGMPLKLFSCMERMDALLKGES